ncbi:MAG: ABC transporter ATP-binding protein [Anaerotruncus sp.]|nr:ABC transporter ATP-binding protein [Anaerotruncus sp.]
MLEVKQVGIVFGGLVALDQVNMSVQKGEIHGLIGPNGSGKTTLINVITGFYEPTSGEVLFDGEVISGRPPHQISHVGLGRTFQNINLFPEMSALENVVTARCVHTNYHMLDAVFQSKRFQQQEAEARDKAIAQLEFVGLKDDLNTKAKNLPYGKRRLLEIARLLATDPKLVLLDEPVAGMNEQESDEVANIVHKMRDLGGRTILLIEHHMRFVMNLCEQLTVLNSGCVIAQGAPSDIQNNEEVIACYLGKRR